MTVNVQPSPSPVHFRGDQGQGVTQDSAFLVRPYSKVEAQQHNGKIEKEKIRVKGVGETQVQIQTGSNGAWGMPTEGCWP